MTQDGDEERDVDESGAPMDGEKERVTEEARSKSIWLSLLEVAWVLLPAMVGHLYLVISVRAAGLKDLVIGPEIVYGFLLIAYVVSIRQGRFRYSGFKKYLYAIPQAVVYSAYNLFMLIVALLIGQNPILSWVCVIGVLGCIRWASDARRGK